MHVLQEELLQPYRKIILQDLQSELLQWLQIKISKRQSSQMQSGINISYV